MSRPNTRNDPQAPLLTEDRPPDVEDEQFRNKITIFNTTFSLFRLIVVIVGATALVAIGISIAAIVLSVEHREGSHTKPKHPKHRPERDVCLTSECVQLSADILRSLGDADPCEDFYEYACGGWENRVEIPSDRGRYGTIDEVSEANNRVLRDILSGPYHSRSPDENLPDPIEAIDVQNFQKLKDAYNACLNEATINELGAKPLLSLLETVIAKYPVDSACHPIKFQASYDGLNFRMDEEQCSETKDSLTEVIEYLQSIGVGALFSLIVTEDSKNTSVNIMSLYQDGSGLPSKNHYTDEDILQKYERAIYQSFTAVFGDKDSEKFKSHAVKIVNFEKVLKDSEMDPEDIQDETKTYNPVTVSNLTNTLPYINFETIIKNLTKKTLPRAVLLTSPAYLEAVNRLLESTSKETIQAYLLWTTMRRFLGHTGANIRKPWEDFSQILAGIDPNVKKERWKTCVKEMDNTLGFLAGEFYVRKTFGGDAKERGRLIIEQIKDAFVERFDELDWVDDDTREVAVRKVKNLRVKVGYNDASPNMTDPVDLAKYIHTPFVAKELNGARYYEKVVIGQGTFFENYLSYVKHASEKAFSSAGEPVDKEEWGMTPQTWNAYYNPPGNEIVFPAGILQSPTFFPYGDDPNYLNFLNYGGFGSVAGHEISHGFDQNGRHYDENGTLTDWWTETTVKGFQKREGCFIDQYEGFTIKAPNGTNVHLNGKLTEGENIADNGGLRAAWNAWQKQRSKLSKSERVKMEPKLPGLDLTPEQLFFLSFARTWCTKTRPESLLVQVLTNPHSPGPYRALGTLQNSPEFAKAFECSKKSKMNVKKKCTLW